MVSREITLVLVMQLSQVHWHLSSFSPKYFPRHPVLEHQCIKTTFYIHIENSSKIMSLMYFYPHIFRSSMHCPCRKRGETTSEVVFLYRQIKEVKNTFVRIVILGSRNSNMTEHGMCLLIEDPLSLSTKRSCETQHTSLQHWKSET
jgi:hypothetical protein